MHFRIPACQAHVLHLRAPKVWFRIPHPSATYSRGKTPALVEARFLDVASELTLYGVELFVASRIPTLDVEVCATLATDQRPWTPRTHWVLCTCPTRRFSCLVQGWLATCFIAMFAHPTVAVLADTELPSERLSDKKHGRQRELWFQTLTLKGVFLR